MSKSLREQVLEKNSGLCFYCGKVLDGTNWHIEHVEPKSRGGSNSLDNYVPACAKCNLEKHTRNLEEYRDHSKQRYVAEVRKSFYTVYQAIARYVPTFGDQAEGILNLAWDCLSNDDYRFVGEILRAPKPVKHLHCDEISDPHGIDEEDYDILKQLPHWDR